MPASLGNALLKAIDIRKLGNLKIAKRNVPGPLPSCEAVDYVEQCLHCKAAISIRTAAETPSKPSLTVLLINLKNKLAEMRVGV
jgi:hypothetical protein